MHPNSLSLMSAMKRKHLRGISFGKVLDVGSYNHNGTYRKIFEGWVYTGVDIRPGPNVAIVDDATRGLHRVKANYDVVISGQMLGYCRQPFAAVRAMANKVKPEGFVFLIASWQRSIADEVNDYWRICPDGMQMLIEEAGLTCLVADWSKWDTFGVGQKPNA